MVNSGEIAPDFQLPDAKGKMVQLKDLRDRMVVLYFYPKDDTSGCTLQAIDFTAEKRKFTAAGARIIGISPDSSKSHQKFAAKHGLGIVLLSDDQKKTVEDYGVWVEKSMYGRKYMGVERTTFLIDQKGIVTEIWRKVKVKDHVAKVLGAVKNTKS